MATDYGYGCVFIPDKFLPSPVNGNDAVLALVFVESLEIYISKILISQGKIFIGSRTANK